MSQRFVRQQKYILHASIQHSALSIQFLRTLASREEIYGLTSQIRRCSASIAANIAEGCGKRGNNEIQRFLQIATGSASELEYHFLLAQDLGFLADEDYRKLDRTVVEVKKMLAGLIKKIEADRLNTEN